MMDDRFQQLMTRVALCDNGCLLIADFVLGIQGVGNMDGVFGISRHYKSTDCNQYYFFLTHEM